MKEADKNEELLQDLQKLMAALEKLTTDAYRKYENEVDMIITKQSNDKIRIETILENLLELCHDKKIYELYKKLCGYYLDIDADATIFYIKLYQNLWNPK